MKNLSYIIVGIIIGSLVTYYFCPRQIEEGAIDIKVVKPKGVISVEQAKDLNANWSRYREAAVDSALASQDPSKKKDDRSTYWSLEDIENYIGYAKKQADSLGYTMSGVRVYLGVYGKNAGQAKKDLTTMFIVPTGKKTNSKASMFSISLQGGRNDLNVPPLNSGTGGNGGYPQ